MTSSNTPPTKEDASRDGREQLVHLGGPKATANGRVDSGAVGRLSHYSLRLSLLEQCNLSCQYCLPGAVVSPTEKRKWLRAADYALLLPLFVERGVTKVRFTGGEPLIRDDVEDIVAAMAAAAPSVDLALTTNGTALAKRAASLRKAGLRRVTVHLDSLRPDRVAALMGRDESAAILAGIEAARDAFEAVKINVVVQKGKNDDEIGDFLAFSKEHSVEVRFIELMNTGSARGYVDDVFMTGAEIVRRVADAAGAHPLSRRHPSDPAALYQTDAGVTFGVIASDTEPFCGACDRLRLTADGRLRGCLYESGGIPLGAALKADADARAIAALMDAALDDKRSYHPLVAPKRVPFSMADIGG